MKRTPRITTRFLATGMLASAIGLTGVANFPTHSVSNAYADAVRVTAPQAPSFADVVEAVSPAVVSVRVEQDYQPASDESGNDNGGDYRFDRRGNGMDQLPPFFRNNPDLFERFFGMRPDRGPDGRYGDRRGNPPRRGHPYAMSQGSGFFISEDGYMVTNNHVVDGGSKYTVVMDDGTEYNAKLIGADERSDLAVLKVEADRKFTYVDFSSTEPRIGEWVVAVGNPFGLGGTVTAGIVSARGREIGANRYEDFIQIDAAVNKGNSGGPAFNLNGEVIGVNTAIYSPSGGNVGIAFAIPASTVKDVVKELMDKGTVVRGWLGVQIQPVTKDIAESLGFEGTTGALVSSPADDSPAQKAGIKAGDVITAVDGTSVKDPRQLARIISHYSPDTDVKVSVWRDGKSQELTVKLGSLGDMSASPAATARAEDKLGLTLRAAPDGAGVEVVEVQPGSGPDTKGVQAGDVIASVNGEEVRNPSDVAKVVEEARKLGRKNTLFQINRDGNSSFVAVPLESDKG